MDVDWRCCHSNLVVSFTLLVTCTDPVSSTTTRDAINLAKENKDETQRAQQWARGYTGSTTTTVAAVTSRTKTSSQLLRPPVPLPPPHRRRQNRCPCGECFLCQEFNTPGECIFHAKAAVAVDGATTAITTTSGGSSVGGQALDHYSRGSGSVMEGSERRSYRRRRPA